jgi:hypothetical protein
MYNKDTAKIKGQESGVTGLLKKKLIQRSNKFHNVIVDINEYNTSQVSIINKYTRRLGKFLFWVNVF